MGSVGKIRIHGERPVNDKDDLRVIGIRRCQEFEDPIAIAIIPIKRSCRERKQIVGWRDRLPHRSAIAEQDTGLGIGRRHLLTQHHRTEIAETNAGWTGGRSRNRLFALHRQVIASRMIRFWAHIEGARKCVGMAFGQE